MRADSVPLIKRTTTEITAGFSADELEVVFRFLNAVIERCAAEATDDF